MPHELIFLIGFMGAGKTTLGRALEARLPGWRYVDLDELIELQAGMSVPKISPSTARSTSGVSNMRRCRGCSTAGTPSWGAAGGPPASTTIWS